MTPRPREHAGPALAPHRALDDDRRLLRLRELRRRLHAGNDGFVTVGSMPPSTGCRVGIERSRVVHTRHDARTPRRVDLDERSFQIFLGA